LLSGPTTTTRAGRQYAADVAEHCIAAGALRVSIIEPPSGGAGWTLVSSG
jgi:hypothetical protein